MSSITRDLPLADGGLRRNRPSRNAFCVAVAGATMGFVWFTARPAQELMGDADALLLGAALGAVALISQYRLLLPIIGIVFAMPDRACCGLRIFGGRAGAVERGNGCSAGRRCGITFSSAAGPSRHGRSASH